MFRGSYRFTLVLVLLSLGLAATQAAPAKAKKPAKVAKAAKTPSPPPVPPPDFTLEPKAMDILKAACSRLAAAKSLTFTAVVSYEDRNRNGYVFMSQSFSTKALLDVVLNSDLIRRSRERVDP